MKSTFKKLTLMMISFLAVGCGTGGSSAENNSSSNNPGGSSSDAPSSSSNAQPSSQHSHNWATDWSNDENNHWHACSGCNEKKDSAAHSFGEWQETNLGTLVGKEVRLSIFADSIIFGKA